MPPKRAALSQALRDAFTEETSFSLVEKWATETLGKLQQLTESARGQRAAIANAKYAHSNASTTPTNVLQLLQQYQAVASDVFQSAEQIRTVISIRIPELKEEDNLGVGVQMTVLKMLDTLQSKLLGGSGGDKDSASMAAGMHVAREYLSSRGGVEDKLLGKSSDDKKDEGGSKAPSVLLELQQTDHDVLLKVELATLQLSTLLRSLINAYALNWKKLIQPRNSMDKMVS